MNGYHLIQEQNAILYDPAPAFAKYVDHCRIVYLAPCYVNGCDRDHYDVMELS